MDEVEQQQRDLEIEVESYPSSSTVEEQGPEDT